MTQDTLFYYSNTEKEEATMRKWLCCLMLLVGCTSWSFAEEQKLDVSVYKQGLVLNGVKMNSSAMQYPLLLFRDVVYMPLSTEMGVKAGFKTVWNDDDKELDIVKSIPKTTPLSGAVYSHPDQVKAEVSGNIIELEDEKLALGTYTPLSYQYVTYIPLSWDFTNNMMKWESAHHPYVGLIVQTDGKKSVEDVLKDFNVKYYEALAAFMCSRNAGYSPASALNMVGMVKENADKNSIDEKWILALWWQESNFNTGSISGHGAIGAMQIMPDTGKRLGYTRDQLLNPEYNVEAGSRYLAGLKNTFSGDLFLATVAYNQGSTRVSRGTYSPRFGNEVQRKYNVINTFVQDYVAK